MTPEQQHAYNQAAEKIEACRRDGSLRLDLSGLGLICLPPEIGRLTALTGLWLHDNQLSSLPPQVGQLTALNFLVLDCNQLTILPPQIGELTALRVLYLQHNQLSSLPPQIGQLNALKQLHLSDNRLSNLPPQMNQLAALTELFLHDNPALAIPESVLGPKVFESFEVDKTAARPQDILNFYFAQRRGATQGTLQAVNEVKVMLVGRARAGKTSLRRFFMGDAHNPHEKETPGIALDSFLLPCEPKDITVRLWDFAGQEITHALHKFFLTEGCVYVLVLTPRLESEMQDAEYWLGLLKRYAGGAPVLVALNQQDARQGGYDVDRRVLQERYPFIQAFIPTNCESREGCDELKHRLGAAVASLKETEPPRLQVPKAWLEVMRECENQTAPMLTLEAFRTICARHNETLPAQQESLARLLHLLGAVLHFVDEPRLRHTSVLKPHWVTDGVYRLLRFKDGPDSDGTLTLAEALQALPGETEASARFFLQLMERFEMCFPLDEVQGIDVDVDGDGDEGDALTTSWLIPGAMEQYQPEGVTAADWQKPGSARMRYVYDPLPEGVLPRFIVLTHLLSEGQPRWRNGVVLQDGQAAALVRRGENRNHVEVTAFGPDAERLRLVQIIRGNLDRIHGDLPAPKPVEELELAGLPGIFRRVVDLEAAELGKQQVAVHTQQGNALVEPTLQLNQASEQKARVEALVPLSVFLSYSHKDRRAKEQFQQNLAVMTTKTLITQWHEGLIESEARWWEEIEANLDKIDVFVGLLTTPFAGAFFGQAELANTRARLALQDKNCLFVLILVNEISLTGLDLAGYQILRPGGKAVSRHKSLEVGFDVAQLELEQLIQTRQRLKQEESLDAPSVERRPASKAQEQHGITIIVQGDYIHGDKPMTHDQSINMRDNYGQAGQTLTNCTNMIQQQAPGPQKNLLEELAKQGRQLIAALPADKQDKAAGNLELAVKAATSAEPDREWYSVSTKGLLEASKWVKDYSGNIAGTITNLGKLLWPEGQG